MATIMVQNQGSIGVQGIRLLGCTQKTSEQIGRFGTGLKEAIALFCRLGIPIVIFSDETRVDFAIQHVDGHDEICFKLDRPWGRWTPDEWHGMGIHPGFGKHDWADIWQALREVFCNAYDESGFHHSICGDDQPMIGVEGVTRVFIEADFKVMQVYFGLPQKLLFMNSHVSAAFSSAAGRILEKIDGEEAQIYQKGVWIQAAADASMWDYELPRIKLSEARTADWYEINNDVGSLLASASRDVICRLLQAIALPDWGASYEATACDSYHFRSAVEDNKKEWVSAWFSLYGEDACACIGDSFIMERVKKNGYMPIVVPNYILRALEKAGIRTYVNVLTVVETEGIDAVSERFEVCDVLWSQIQRINVRGVCKPGTLMFVKECTDETCRNNGFLRDGNLYLNADIIGSEIEREWTLYLLAQHISGKRPGTYDFENWLTKAILKVI